MPDFTGAAGGSFWRQRQRGAGRGAPGKLALGIWSDLGTEVAA
ncbi:hypothetical protein [Hymenobacter properus]|nr:hypothetical protein [Hymenobacter properus]